MKIKSSLGFFREVHGIPKRQKLAWCIFPKVPNDESSLQLGVMLVGTDKLINVASGRFAQVKKAAELSPEIATRSSEGDWFVYRTTSGRVMRLPKNYVADMYRTMVYSPELMDSYLM